MDSRFLLSHIRHYPLLQERSLDFARDDVTEVALSQHIRCTLREINPFPHTVISSAARNLPCTLLFLASFAEGFPFSAVAHRTLYRCARKIEGFARDDDTGIVLSKHIRCTLREINPFPPPSFRAQREIFLALYSFLLLSQKVSPFPLSHIGRYTSMQERSLHFGRDDDTGIALSKHIRCTMREINPSPHTVISSAARNLPCTLLFLAPFPEGFPFSAVAHRTLYRCARKIEGFARDDVA